MSKSNFKVVKKMNCGQIVKNNLDQFFFEDEDGNRSNPYGSVEEAVGRYYVQQACDHLGNSIRDNSLEEKISMGKQIDKGIWVD